MRDFSILFHFSYWTFLIKRINTHFAAHWRYDVRPTNCSSEISHLQCLIELSTIRILCNRHFINEHYNSNIRSIKYSAEINLKFARKEIRSRKENCQNRSQESHWRQSVKFKTTRSRAKEKAF